MNFKRRFVSIVSAAVCTLSLSMASLTANAENSTTESVSEGYVQQTERNNYSLDVSSQTVLTLSKEVSTKSKEAVVTTTVSAVKSETVSTAVVVSHRHEVSVSVYIPVTSAAASTSVTPVTLTTTTTTAMSIAGWYFTDVTCEASAERIAVKPSEKVSMKLDLMSDKGTDAKVNLDLPEGITVENVYDENENKLEYSSSDNSFTLSGRYAVLSLNVDSEMKTGTYQIGFDISQRKNVPNTLNNGGIAYNYVYSVSGGTVNVKDSASDVTTAAATTTNVTDETDISSTTISTEISSESSVSVSTDNSGTNTSETSAPLTTTSVSFTSGGGDANNDGKLDVRDAAEIAKAAASGKISELPLSADYNGDGVVNVRDAAAIARVLAKREILNK